MHGVRRILVFCTLVVVLPIILLLIPLYLRHCYADVAYAVTESDIMEVTDGISTIFCSKHILKMNSTFNAFQMAQRPEIASKRKHLKLKKSMNIPDDTLEYWGFYLLKGATVALSVCSRFPGASILVVKGEKNLRTCGLLEHNINKKQIEDIYLPGANKQVKIIYESNAQEIDSKESTIVKPINIYNTSNVHIPLINVSSENSTKGKDKVLINMNDTWLYKSDEQLLKDILHDTTAPYILNIDDQQEIMYRIRKLRHLRRYKIRNQYKKITQKKYIKKQNRKLLIQKLKQELHSDNSNEKYLVGQEVKLTNKMIGVKRVRRSRELIIPSTLLDQGVKHGGNTDKNFTSSFDEDSFISSFENDLFNCYGGAILLTHKFESSNQCTNISYLLSGKHMQANHHVEEDGYYYYIFYSDNDIVSNDIYAIFDIYKPTFQYEDVSESCINKTECSFSLSPLTANRVIVEIPTKDGIEHDEMDDNNILISTCQPRMGIYMFFPITMLLLITGFSFI